MSLRAPEPLNESHRLDGFASGETSLDEWLRRRALPNQINHSSRTFVVTDGDEVIAYYCLSAGAIAHAQAPSKLKRNRPDPVPVVVLGRLAVDQNHHDKGLGTALLRDAVLRTLQAREHAGVVALLVHALSERARRFYRSRGFLESPIQPMTLCLMLSTVEAALGEG